VRGVPLFWTHFDADNIDAGRDINITTMVGSASGGGVSWCLITLSDFSFVDAKKEILLWLHAPDPSETHNRLSEEHHEGTGEWFLTSKTFQEWEETLGAMLWIKGIRTFHPTLLI
jgi:hypothetical protein